MKLYFLMLFVVLAFCHTLIGHGEVAGVEVKVNFSEFDEGYDHFEFNPNAKVYAWIDTGNGYGWIDLTAYIKFGVDIPIYPNVAIRRHNGSELIDEQSIPLSIIKSGLVYDYFNVYGDHLHDKLELVMYYKSCLDPLNALSSEEAERFDSCGPIEADTMYFLEANMRLINTTQSSLVQPNALSTISVNYLTNDFVNDFPTSRVVKVIAPNNPHFEEYQNYLNFISQGVVLNGYIPPPWDDIASEMVVEPGEKITLPDANNCFHVQNNQLKRDNDGDKIPTVVEYLKTLTNPFDKDTDKDGLYDYNEVFGTNMVLNLTTGAKNIDIHTIAIVPDTDGDGIKDGDEIYAEHKYMTDGVEHHYSTNPCSRDSDDDGIPDDLDLHPLDPNNIKSDWTNYWSTIAARAGITVCNLFDDNADCDSDGISNLNERLNKTNPIFSNGFHKVIFEPEKLDLTIGRTPITESFSATFFASDVITGVVHISKLDWDANIAMDGYSVFWPDFLREMPEDTCVTFVSPNYKKIDFKLTLDPKTMNKGVTQEWVRVIDQFGPYSQELPITCNMLFGNNNLAPSIPELIEPEDGAILYLTNDVMNVDSTNVFSWSETTDPEGVGVYYILKLFHNDDSLSLTTTFTSISLLISEYFTDIGYYYWKVSAIDFDDNIRNSKQRNFYVWVPGDSDNDGFDDNYEIRHGTDPYDSKSTPLFIDTDETLPNGYLGRDYYYRLKAKGGSRRPCFWLLNTNGNPPPGLHVTYDGELRGAPEEEGDFVFFISVFDGTKYETKPVHLTIEPKREGLGVKAGKGTR